MHQYHGHSDDEDVDEELDAELEEEEGIADMDLPDNLFNIEGSMWKWFYHSPGRNDTVVR